MRPVITHRHTIAAPADEVRSTAPVDEPRTPPPGVPLPRHGLLPSAAQEKLRAAAALDKHLPPGCSPRRVVEMDRVLFHTRAAYPYLFHSSTR